MYSFPLFSPIIAQLFAKSSDLFVFFHIVIIIIFTFCRVRSKIGFVKSTHRKANGMNDNKIEKSKFKFDYSYVIIALCFLTVCLSLGFCSSPKSMYLTAITDALGMERGVFSLSDTFRHVTTSVVTVFFGFLVWKFGTKKLMCVGFLALIGYTLVSTYATTAYGFWAAGALLGFGLSFTSTSMASVVINKWCTKNKGTITGIVLAANGLGGAISAQILSPIIFEEGNPLGYRNSYNLVAAILVVLLVLVLIFFKDAPKGSDKSVTVKKKKARGTGWVGMEFSDTVRKPYFYVAIVCVFLTGMSLTGISGIHTPHFYDVGLSKPFVATILTVGSLCLLTSKFLVGFLFDRYGIRLTMNICYVCALLTLVFMMLVGTGTLGRVMAVSSKVIDAFALPLETVMLPLFASELFGNKSFEKSVGFFVAANYAGCAVGSPFANYCFDKFQNYNVAIFIFLSAIAIVFVAMNFVVHKSHRDRRAILANFEE